MLTLYRVYWVISVWPRSVAALWGFVISPSFILQHFWYSFVFEKQRFLYSFRFCVHTFLYSFRFKNSGTPTIQLWCWRTFPGKVSFIWIFCYFLPCIYVEINILISASSSSLASSNISSIFSLFVILFFLTMQSSFTKKLCTLL